MLARNAESLYWIGRYVERADDTARILDVTVHQLLEDSSVDPDQASRTLLRVLGIEPPETALDLPALTAKDVSDLEFVAKHADMVAHSLVQRPEDIELLLGVLTRLRDDGSGRVAVEGLAG